MPDFITGSPPCCRSTRRWCCAGCSRSPSSGRWHGSGTGSSACWPGASSARWTTATTAAMTMQEKQGRTVAQLLRSIGRLLIVALAVLMTLNQFINIGPILAGAGILGLAVSFGAQSLVKDIITGFFMLVENSLSVGRHGGDRGQDRHRGAGDAARGAPSGCRWHAARHPERPDHDGEQPDPRLVARRGGRDGGLRVRSRSRTCRVPRGGGPFRRRPASGRACSTGRRKCSACSSSPSVASPSARCCAPTPGKQWEVARGFRYRILERLWRVSALRSPRMPNVSALGTGVRGHAGRRGRRDPGQRAMTLQLLQHADPDASSRSRRSRRPTSRSTPADPRSGVTRTSGTSGPSSSRTCCGGGSRRAAIEVFHIMNLTDVDDRIIDESSQGRDAHRRIRGALHPGVQRGPRLAPHPAGARAAARDRIRARDGASWWKGCCRRASRTRARTARSTSRSSASRRTAGCRSSTSASFAPARAAG